MPEFGDLCHGRDLGFTGGSGGTIYTWRECPRCKQGRWSARKEIRKSKTGFCRKCFHETFRPSPTRKFYHGEEHASWKGGRYLHPQTKYVYIRLYKDDFFYRMVISNGYVAEHRLVMAKSLGRNLHPWEIVHHKHTRYPAGSNEDKQDNRIENLQLVSDDKHKQITLMENRIHYLEDRVTNLEAEIVLLKTQSAKPIMDGV